MYRYDIAAYAPLLVEIFFDDFCESSLAIVMWELLNGLIPWKGMDIVQIIQKVTSQLTNQLCCLIHSLMTLLFKVTDKANDVKGQSPPGRPPIDAVLYQTAPPGYIQLMQVCWAQVRFRAYR